MGELIEHFLTDVVHSDHFKSQEYMLACVTSQLVWRSQVWKAEAVVILCPADELFK